MTLFKLQRIVADELKKVVPLYLSFMLKGVKGAYFNDATLSSSIISSNVLSLVICMSILIVIIAFIVKFLIDVILG